MQNNTQTVAKNKDYQLLRDMNPVATLAVDYFSKRDRQARTTQLQRFQHELEAYSKKPVNWDQLVAFFKGLNDIKAGALITGRGGNNVHRFEWGLSLIDVAKAAQGQLSPDAIRSAPTGKTRVVYPVGYSPKKKNKNAVRAKRSGVKGRIAGEKNKKSRTVPTRLLDTPRIVATPAAVGRGIEVMVVENDRITRYEVPADKTQGFKQVLPAFAIAK